MVSVGSVQRSSRVRALRIAACVLGLAVVPLAQPGGAAAVAPAPGTLALGINADKLFGLPVYRWDPLLAEVAGDHTQVVRYTANWAGVEPNPPGATGHDYRWGFYDAVVSALARHGLRWLPVIGYSTSWSASYYTTSGVIFTTRTPYLRSPPVAADVPDYADFAAAVVSRYGPNGTFWAANPELTREPVDEVQIWNEENSPYFWAPSPDAARYASLYSAARQAVRAVAPSVRVSLGALANSAGAFLNQMFAAAGASFAFDEAADTPYDQNPTDVERDVADLRSALDAHGRPTTPIEVSEFGWPTRGSVSWAATMTDAQRASAISQTMQTLGTGDCGVDLITPYTWITAQQDTNSAYDWFGLVNANGFETNSSGAYTTAIARLVALEPIGHAAGSPCGRPFSVAAAPAGGPIAGAGPGTTCVQAQATSGTAGGVPGATLTVSASDGTETWSGRATGDGTGSGTVCLAIPAGTPLTVTVSAEHPYFAPIPTVTLAMTAA